MRRLISREILAHPTPAALFDGPFSSVPPSQHAQRDFWLTVECKRPHPLLSIRTALCSLTPADQRSPQQGRRVEASRLKAKRVSRVGSLKGMCRVSLESAGMHPQPRPVTGEPGGKPTPPKPRRITSQGVPDGLEERTLAFKVGSAEELPPVVRTPADITMSGHLAAIYYPPQRGRQGLGADRGATEAPDLPRCRAETQPRSFVSSPPAQPEAAELPTRPALSLGPSA
ncbi:hypothetical protein GN956_G19587 [Arapaima gigas]